MDRKDLVLYGITDKKWLANRSMESLVEEAILGGTSIIQLREKDISYEDFKREASLILKICRYYKVPLIINDNVALALDIGADGVHVGSADEKADSIRKKAGNKFIIGVTAKNLEEAKEAERLGADYIGSGAIFASKTKENAKAISKKDLENICKAVNIPVVAIGGITLNNVEELKAIDIAGVAVSASLFDCDDIRQRAIDFRHKLERKAKVLSIAASDSSACAGIQADLKTCMGLGAYGMTAITALTAQNTFTVNGILPTKADFLESQIDTVFTDIEPEAIKIGMLANKENIEVLVERLSFYKAKNIVIDPVFISTSGTPLLEKESIYTLKEKLFPLATLVTPNIPELETIVGRKVITIEDITVLAKELANTYKTSFLIKGGHFEEKNINDFDSEEFIADKKVCDYLYSYEDSSLICYEADKVINPNSRGTGCTLSTAIAVFLAKGYSLKEAVRESKKYINKCMKNGLYIGKGPGPLGH